ncbi:MAG TPA: hypothetical protein VEL03_06030 [Streptosporangiaceae bacterium]|nr:hypothetical protein [Streptosporangiaceae bacterium]
MSAGAQTKPSGPSAAGESAGGLCSAGGTAAGRLFARLTLLPALLAVAWILVGLPLLMAGLFTPVLMLVFAIPVAVGLVYAGFRLVPARRADPQLAGQPSIGSSTWWPVLGVLVVVVAFVVDQLIFNSQFIIITRDPASYIQFAAWISGHGSLPIPQDLAAFGGRVPGLSFYSPAYYQVGSTIVPQFMAGLPMVLAGAFWVGGVSAAVAMGPVLGACAILTFGGLVARLVGPRWAPLAALALALALPMQFTSRSTYSETLAAVLFLGGLSLAVDCLGTGGAAARVLAGLAGLALGLTFAVRLDGASDILPVIPYCGLLFLTRRQQALPMAVGFTVGAVYGGIDGVLLTFPYLKTNESSVIPLTAIVAVVVALTVLVTVVQRVSGWLDRRYPDRGGSLRRPFSVPKWLPDAMAALAVLAAVGLTIRPYVQVARAASPSSFQAAIATDQISQGLPIDPARTYYDISMNWVFWYLGVPAVILGTLGAAILVRRCLRGGMPGWTLPLLVFGWAIVSTLYRPAIMPDQPWASRRLVPAVLPGFILLAVWAVSWLAGWLRARGAGQVARGAIVGCCAAALLIPATITTFGLHLRTGGPAGIRLTADGLAFKTTYAGEIPAVNDLCSAMPKDATVVFVNAGIVKAAPELAEVIRGMCDRPTGILINPTPASVSQVVGNIYRAGRRPVLLAGFPDALRQYGGPLREVMDLVSTQDDDSLTKPPMITRPYTLVVWMSEPPS